MGCPNSWVSRLTTVEDVTGKVQFSHFNPIVGAHGVKIKFVGSQCCKDTNPHERSLARGPRECKLSNLSRNIGILKGNICFENSKGNAILNKATDYFVNRIPSMDFVSSINS